MKVLHVNTVYGIGSTGKIIASLHHYLEQNGHESFVCYGRGPSFSQDSNLLKIDSKFEVLMHVLLARISGFQGCFSNNATRRLIKKIEKFKPDIIHLFGLHGYYLNEDMLFTYLKTKNIPIIYGLADEYAYTGKCCYAFECKKYQSECYNCPEVHTYPASFFFDRSNYFFNKKKDWYTGISNITFSSTEYIVKRARQSTLLAQSKIEICDANIDTTHVFFPSDSIQLRNNYDISEDDIVVICVAVFSNERKGAQYFMKAAECLKDSSFVFLQIGFDGAPRQCPKNVIPIPYTSDQKLLAQYYSMADIMVCTSLADAMPNACIEALACGTPLIAFAQTGTSYVAPKELCTLVPSKDIGALTQVIQKVCRKTPEMILKCRQFAVERYSDEAILGKILDIFRSCIDNRECI